MNIYVDLILFVLVVVIYRVITDLFTIMFRFTGLPGEKARFQVLSLLTGTGFTTRESEIILSNRQRRTLARITMIFGYVFNITIVSAFINVFLTFKLSQAKQYTAGILFLLGGVVLFVVLTRLPQVRAWANRQLEKLADRMIGRDKSHNTVLLLDYIGNDSIAQVNLNVIPERFLGLPLSKTGLKTDTGILVMLVEHSGKKAVPATADTVFAVGDKLTVFGDYSTICRTFQAREHFADR